ncbi:MAG: DUF63 family protein [Candidatus Methanofastidiosia archaeon]
MSEVTDVIIRFIREYFINPIRYHTGYNVINTLTYALILVVAVYYVLKLLEKMDITIDRKFIKALMPFMVVGGTSRALVDAGVYPDTFLFITPCIYITIFLLTFVSLVIVKTLADKKGIMFHKNLQKIGIVLASVNIVLIACNTQRPIALAYIFVPFFVFYFFIIWITKKLNINFLKNNEYILGAHIFDASTTFCGIFFYNYLEQHVVTSFFIDLFGPAVMFPLKIIFISVNLYLIELILPDKEIENLNIKNFLKLVIIVLGLGPGIRNMSTIIMAA